MDRLGRLMGGKYTSRSLGTAFFAAVSDLLPVQDPFAAPRKATSTDWTDFGGQKRFSVAGGHEARGEEKGPPWPFCGTQRFLGAGLESADAAPNPPKDPWAGYTKPDLPPMYHHPRG